MTGDESETGNEVRARARISANKAIRSSVVEVLTAKAAGSSSATAPPICDDDNKPKKEKPIRPKKEKTPEELQQSQFQKDCEKNLNCNSS